MSKQNVLDFVLIWARDPTNLERALHHYATEAKS